MSDQPVVWVVATEQTAARWSHAVSQNGLHAVPLAWGAVVAGPDVEAAIAKLREPSDAWVVITSGAALQFLPTDAGLGRHVACVGPRTANLAVACGFTVAMMGTEDAATMARRLAAGPGPTRAVVLRTTQGRDDVVDVLTGANWDLEIYNTYDVVAVATLVNRVGAAPTPQAIIVGSPRAAQALIQAHPAAQRAAVVAVGETTAQALRDLGCTRVAVADHPNAVALVAAAQRVVRKEL